MQTKLSPAPLTVSRNSWPSFHGYRINTKHHSAQEITALLSRIEPGETINGCWKWNGDTDKDGHPVLKSPHSIYAAKMAYIVFLDSEPLHGYTVKHECENKECLNPDHLTLGPYRKNLDTFRQKTEYIYEDELPKNLTEDEYDEWLEKSREVDGVRIGPAIT